LNATRLTEDCILVGLLILMLGMAITQIVMRNLFASGIVWGDSLVRVLVLWISLVGAMIAARQDRHISIDAVSRYLPERFRIIVRRLTNLFAAAVCLVAGYYSFQFIRIEFEDGAIAFAGIPAWLCEAIIPFALAVIGLRYFFLFLSKAAESTS